MYKNKPEIKISVIIPVLNAEKTLAECLDSVISQTETLKDIEIICTDDGSTDSSPDILKKYAQKYDFIKVYTQTNSGSGTARNKGLEAAAGEFTAFMDADDLYPSNQILGNLYDSAIKNNVKICGGSFNILDIESGIITSEFDYPLDGYTFKENKIVYYSDYQFDFGYHRFIYDLKMLRENNIVFPEYRRFQDPPFFVKAMIAAGNFYALSEASYLYRLRNNPVIWNEKNILDLIRGIHDVLNLSDENNLQGLFGYVYQRFTDHIQVIEEQSDNNYEVNEIYTKLKEKFENNINKKDINNTGEVFFDMSKRKRNNVQVTGQNKIQNDEIETVYDDKEDEYDEAAVETPGKISRERSDIPKVSAVIPVYNVEHYLREALDSVVNQTLYDIEIICVNDGSTDGCLEILKEYAEKDDRIIVINKPNAGYGHSMNVGIFRAKGEYIAILEPDDYIGLNMYEDLYNTAKENNLDIVKSDFYRFKGSGNNINKKLHKCCNHSDKYNIVINPAEYLEIFRYVMNTWCGLYRRGLITEENIRHNETPGASFQDNGFFFQTMCKSERIMYVNKAYYMNRRDNPNSSVKSREKVYAVNTEHEYISKFFGKNPELNNIFKGVHFLRKFGNYKFTLSRIDESYKREYINKISEEFKIDMELGNIRKDIMDPFEWHDIQWIIRDPDEFYYDFIRWQIKVSVIIPVYNAENYLGECLSSVVKQTLKDIEIILIDDGSTDSSLEIMREFAENDDLERIKIIQQENLGSGAARNKGLDIARGKYLAFLDADDFFEPLMLREAYNKSLYDNNAEICIFKAKYYDNETKKTSPIPESIKIDRLPRHRPFSINNVTANIFTVTKAWVWNKLFKRSFILNNGIRFQEISSSNDMYFTYAALLKSNRITVLDKELVYYRINNKNSIQNNLSDSWENFYIVRSRLQKELFDMNVYARHEQKFINYVFESYFWMLEHLVGDSEEKFFDKGLSQYFDEFGLTGHDREYFWNERVYKIYEKMILFKPGQFSAYKLVQLERQKKDLDDKIVELTTQYESKIAEIKSSKEIEGHKKNLDNKITELTAQYENKLAEAKENTDKPDFYQTELDLVRKSLSFRIGQFFTFIPRKIRDLLKRGKNKK